MPKFKLLSVLFLLMLSIVILAPSGVGAADPIGDWPDLYDPFVLRHIDLQMDSGDWNTIVNDASYTIEVPAQLSAEGDSESILVSVRRKSATLLGSDKVSLKVDINEYHDDNGGCVGFPGATCAETWHGVKKMSLENGDDNNVISEGLAWYLNRVAAERMDYTPGYASWVTLAVNGNSKGVYVNVEQRDKQWLKNHDLYAGGDETWLYKYSDIDSPEIKVGPEDESVDSPLYNELCYLPFKARKPCPTPSDFKARLNARINMESVLTYGAVAAFMGSPDDLYPKDKNFYFVDYLTPNVGLREYVQWDLDSAFSANKVDGNIYNQGGGKSDYYEKALVEDINAPFRDEYDAIMWDLMEFGFKEADLIADFNAIEAAIGAAVDADPNNQVGTAAGEFDKLRQFIGVRRANVIAQLPDPPVDPDPPVASFTYADDYLSVAFTDTSTGTIDSWQWDFGDFRSSTEQNPSRTYAAAGTYTVSLTVTNEAGSSTATQTITVNAPPAPEAGFTYLADYLAVDFTDTSTGDIESWSWDFGDGSSSSAASPSHTYAAAGAYTVSLMVTNDGGSNTASETITVEATPPPDPPVAGFTYLADYLEVAFTDTSTGTIDSWSWNFGDGSSSSAASPSHTYAAAGEYTVSLTVTNGGGSSTASETFTVEAAPPPDPPVASFTYSASGLVVDFTDTSTGTVDSWLWDFGDGGGSTAANPSHTYSSTGSRTVTLTVTNAGGISTTSQIVAVTAPANSTLAAVGYKVKGVHYATLSWSNFSAATLDISRDGQYVTTVANAAGTYDDKIGGKGGWGYYVYEVCGTGTGNCVTAIASAP